MPYPPFSISETTTYPATFEEDLAAYKAAGVDGVGIWEFKLPKGQDARSIDALHASGLPATSFQSDQLSSKPVRRSNRTAW